MSDIIERTRKLLAAATPGPLGPGGRIVTALLAELCDELEALQSAFERERDRALEAEYELAACLIDSAESYDMRVAYQLRCVELAAVIEQRKVKP